MMPITLFLILVVIAKNNALSCFVYFSVFFVQMDDKAALDEGRRATWLETRDIEEDFKELVFLTMQEVSGRKRTCMQASLVV